MVENIETLTTEYLCQLVEEIEDTIDELQAKKRKIQDEMNSRR